MVNEREDRLGTLRSYMDSGKPVEGACFQSKEPLTRNLERKYVVYSISSPDGEQYIQAIPLKDSENPREIGQRAPVSILLWQHNNDEAVQ